MKTFDVSITMASKNKHFVRIKARSVTAAMMRVVRAMLPFEVHSLRIREGVQGESNKLGNG